MASGVRYRIASVFGTAGVITLAIIVANNALVQQTFSLVPYFGRPAPVVLTNGDLIFVISTTLVVMLGSMWPLFKPRPRRILDTVLLTQKRVIFALMSLAALGYFNYTYRLPRSTLMLSTVVLLVLLPIWTVAIRRRRPASMSRAIIVGDDPATMEAILAAADQRVIGYVAPVSSYESGRAAVRQPIEMSDGGQIKQQINDLSCLGGLSRLEEVLVKHDIDTVLFAFAETDRAEFFGTLDVCYDHGVTAMVHREHADTVLTASVAGGELVEVDLEPWDWQDYVIKRLFDIAFATVGLVGLSPVMVVIAVLIKLDSPGPILYGQQRTAEFGGTFSVYKFRSMIPKAELETGAKLSEEDKGEVDPRVTRIGRILRKTHLDEIPQLWSILLGHMSVVGPRPERPELDSEMEAGTARWRSRWFVKPGLTGLAQINDATGHDPQEKLRYDVKYIRRQSFWYDLMIVIRQLWVVFEDILDTVQTRS